MTVMLLQLSLMSLRLWGVFPARLCHSFIARDGTIEVHIVGRRKRSDLPQGGLDVSCKFIFTGKQS